MVWLVNLVLAIMCASLIMYWRRLVHLNDDLMRTNMLLALWLHGDLSAVDAADITDLPLSRVYRALRWLEDVGLVWSQDRAGGAARGGRPRRVYSLSTEGRAWLRAWRERTP